MLDVLVVLYTNLSRKVTASLDQIVPKPVFDPQGFGMCGGRKFIVLKCEFDLMIVLAEKMSLHKDIYEATREEYPEYEVSGGGIIEFSAEHGRWKAEFKGESGSYGPYDPIILHEDIRKEISRMMGMPCRFSWHD